MIQRKWGWKPSYPVKANKYALHAEMKNPKVLPSAVDLSPLCSPIEDQGQHGTCVGHGTAAVLEFLELWELRQKLPPEKAPEVFEPKFDSISRLFIYANARLHDGTPLYQDSGTAISSAIWGIRKKGICRESVWPYADQLVAIQPGAKAYAEASAHKILWDYQLDNTNLNELKQCLAWGYPIVYGQTVYDSMMTQEVARSGYIPYPSDFSSPEGGHCMAIVGYSDADKKFKIRNSWGTSWGQSGYGSIDYAYLTDSGLASDFWTLRKNSPVT